MEFFFSCCSKRIKLGSGTGSKSRMFEGAKIDKYLIGEHLGHGTYSDVFKALDKDTNKLVAIKIVDKTKTNLNCRNELPILSSSDHPNVLKALDIMNDNKYLYIVTSLYDEDLLELLRKERFLSDQRAKEVIQQIGAGLLYVKKKGWIHRDLKLENILHKCGVYVVADWGFSRMFEPGKYIMGESIGSLCYAAPEILRGESYVGPECDVWSLGVIIFALRAGVLPFIDKNKSTHETRDMIIEKHYVVPPEFSVELRHLLSQIFVEPDKRIDLEQVLSHPWMAERDM